MKRVVAPVPDVREQLVWPSQTTRFAADKRQRGAATSSLATGCNKDLSDSTSLNSGDPS